MEQQNQPSSKKQETGVQKIEIKQNQVPAVFDKSPSSFIRKCSKLGPVKSAQLKCVDTSQNFHSIKIEIGEDVLAAKVSVMILNLQEALNLKHDRVLSEDAILDVAFTVIDNYSNLSLQDFGYIVSQAKAGAYGNIMVLNSSTIGSWCKKVWDDIQEQIIVVRQNGHLSIKSATGTRDV